MGRFRVKGVQFNCVWAISFSVVFGIQGLSLIPRSDCFHTRSNSHSVAVRGGCTNIPLAAVAAQEGETILNSGFSDHSLVRFVHPDPPGLQVLEDFWNSVCACRQADTIVAPSIMTPAVTYFQSATSSLRASATMVVFLRRPPLRLTRSLNQMASADCG